MQKDGSAEHDRVRPGKTVFADVDRLRRLPTSIEIDGVSEQLRAKTANGGKRADPDPRRAIDQVPAADSGVALHNQFRPALRLMRKMPARAARKSGDPIQLPNDGVRAEMKQVDILAKRQVTDARAFFHDEFFRENPGEPDPAGGMDRITELLFEKRTAEAPGQEQGQEAEKRFHAAAPSER